MKPGRNDLCPCGSGKKYKRCCLGQDSKLHAPLFNDIEQIAAMNPNLTLDELSVVIERQIEKQNESAQDDFCGLSPTQMGNWFDASFHQLQGVTINTPEDLSASPVMRYLTLIFDEAMKNDGSFKATAKGNLPAHLVKQASELLPEFAVSQFAGNISISEFAGRNEDKFNALHYTRILAEVAGIIYRRSGRYHIKKAAQAQYQKQGIHGFFKPMLDAAVSQYNWRYFDLFEDDVDLRMYWLFMVWRLQQHACIEQLTDEVITAFPYVLEQLGVISGCSLEKSLDILIESRFISRFLQFWGFVTLDPKQGFSLDREPRTVQLQPLLADTFHFTVNV